MDCPCSFRRRTRPARWLPRWEPQLCPRCEGGRVRFLNGHDCWSSIYEFLFETTSLRILTGPVHWYVSMKCLIVIGNFLNSVQVNGSRPQTKAFWCPSAWTILLFPTFASGPFAR